MLNKKLHIKLVNKIKSFSKSKDFHQFVDVLYGSSLSDSMHNIDSERLYNSACDLFKLFKEKRKHGEHKVHIYKPNKDDDDIIIHIINDNVPFLVDSISNEIKKQEFDVQFITHPVVPCSRGTSGELKSFSQSNESQYDSIIQLHVSKRCEDNYYKVLEKTLLNVIECINYAVLDWKAMSHEMGMAIEEVEGLNIKNKKNKEESVEFLNWLVNNHFVFLGCFVTDIEKTTLVPKNKSGLGIMKSKVYPIFPIELDEQYKDDNLLLIRKWDSRSIVHRTSHMDWIVIKRFDKKGKCIGAYNFAGFFTSSVYYQSVLNIPLINTKVKEVIKKANYAESSHNEKELITVLESLPRAELLQMNAQELFETSIEVVSLALMPKVRLFARHDKTKRFVSNLVYIPRNRFSTTVRQKVAACLSDKFQGKISKMNVHWTESQMVRLHIVVSTDPKKEFNCDLSAVENEIEQLVSVWQDKLYCALKKNMKKKEAKAVLFKYQDAFNNEYTNSFSAEQAVKDIMVVEGSDIKNPTFKVSKIGNGNIELKIFSPNKELHLSSIMPIVENMGFFAIDVVTYPLSLGDSKDLKKVYLHCCKLKVAGGELGLKDIVLSNIEEALLHIFNHDVEDDYFNKLIICCNLSWREALLVRAYAKYLKQIKFNLDSSYIVDTLSNNRDIVVNIIKLFNAKFEVKNSSSEKVVNSLVNKVREQLSEVSSVSEDKVLRAYLSLILATKRTNFFQTENGQAKDYISFKIASGEMNEVPMPKPYFEIYVYSLRFEAVHLRGGAVARGGLRWSDRTEDFRTEVLGLMKAQMTKNSVIVPVGSKGGFVVKQVSMSDGREVFLKEGVECYKKFLSGMLDITDNIVEGKIVPPQQVVRHDADDPYLVVAADKGTATFSDYANEVSDNYGFWLSDAFASGGSVGYDHKKMGITAKGAWVSVERHFREMGVDTNKEPFTVVGVGDMMGDVFGNGMLLSKCIKLVAAFNHMHIFVDPNPDHVSSYVERERMFKLPRSSWADYNKKLISKGGGIFERSAKSIKISSQMAEVFDIEEKELAPDDLIVKIIKSRVDLFWNGGIGTYIKSNAESHEQIGDKANDALRVNGKELRCKVVGEGGNLGATQRGRMEFARSGGRVNTDFIDNSAGVDCSDHEVNIKIALVEAMSQGLSKKKREALLSKMTKEVGEMVLVDNYKQTQLISIEENHGKKAIESHAWLMKHLEHNGELNRKVEFLPSNEEIEAMLADGVGMTRPSLSVLVTYAKNSMYNVLSDVEFAKDSDFDDLLISYFPSDLQKKYKDILLNHKLKNEIIATMLVNNFINVMGCTYFHQLHADGFYSAEEIVKAFVIVSEIFDINRYWTSIEQLSGTVSLHTQIALFKEIQVLMERNIEWVLRHHKVNKSSKIIEVYAKQVSDLKNIHKNYKSERLFGKYGEEVSSKILSDLSVLSRILPACDIIKISLASKQKINKVNDLFFNIVERISLRWMLNLVRTHTATSYIDKQALKAIVSELEDITISLVEQEVSCMKANNGKCLDNSKSLSEYKHFISELKNSTKASVPSILMIAIKKIKEFIHG